MLYLKYYYAAVKPLYWECQLKYPWRPVIGMSAFEADAYCAWIGARLPTDEELEKAFESDPNILRIMLAAWELTSSTDAGTDSYRVYRGGPAQLGVAGYLRASYRYGLLPDDRHGNLGFRCVRPASIYIDDRLTYILNH